MARLGRGRGSRYTAPPLDALEHQNKSVERRVAKHQPHAATQQFACQHLHSDAHSHELIQGTHVQLSSRVVVLTCTCLLIRAL